MVWYSSEKPPEISPSSAPSAKIRRILVTSDGAALVAPCGACLQRILEFSLPETEILLADREGVKKTMTINELLPNAFKEF